MQKSSVITFVCVLSIAVATTSLVLWRTSQNQAAKSATEQRERIGHLEAEMQALRESQAVGNMAVNAALVGGLKRLATEHGAPETASSVGATAAASPSNDEQNPGPVENEDKLVMALEARFAGEKSDPKWSPNAAVTIRNRVTPLLPKESRLRTLDCRESMCRIETTHKDLDSYRSFVSASYLSRDFGWNGPMMSRLVRSTTNEVLTVAYLQRPEAQ